MNTNLKERAVLMRFSVGLPGEQRQDLSVTADVKPDKQLGERAGKWEKFLYPPEALKPIKQKQTEARDYHNAATLPFDTGIGILPAALIKEYSDRMRDFKGQIECLVENTFLADPAKWIEWARKEHNRTFDPANYPGCSRGQGGDVQFDPDKFRVAMREKFYFRTEPLPVPDAEHFCSNVASLLGTDLEAVNLRVRDAAVEAQKELMARILCPVKKMAEVLSRKDPRIYETLTGNIRDICRVAPALNMADDPTIASLVKECEDLARVNPETLRQSQGSRDTARAKAEALVAKLSAYKL